MKHVMTANLKTCLFKKHVYQIFFVGNKVFIASRVTTFPICILFLVGQGTQPDILSGDICFRKFPSIGLDVVTSFLLCWRFCFSSPLSSRLRPKSKHPERKCVSKWTSVHEREVLGSMQQIHWLKCTHCRI